MQHSICPIPQTNAPKSVLPIHTNSIRQYLIHLIALTAHCKLLGMFRVTIISVHRAHVAPRAAPRAKRRRQPPHHSCGSWASRGCTAMCLDRPHFTEGVSHGMQCMTHPVAVPTEPPRPCSGWLGPDLLASHAVPWGKRGYSERPFRVGTAKAASAKRSGCVATKLVR